MLDFTMDDIDGDDLAGLSIRYAPTAATMLGTVLAAAEDPEAGEWHLMIAGPGAHRTVIDDAGAGADAWHAGQIVHLTLGGWHGQGGAAALQGLHATDILALPADPDAVPRVVERVEMLVA